MQIYQNMSQWQAFRQQFPSSVSIGFVPTMGNLHAGHASLYEASRKANDITIASLFVNPSQFNDPEDYKRYPRTLQNDLDLLKKWGVDYLLLPEEKDIYPQGYSCQISENSLSLMMEGRHRPGHFTGVLTIVVKLLNLVRPDRAYFGEKDYQQYQLIKKTCEDLFMNVEIIPCPTIREADGLAFSSRNNRLSKKERLKAGEFARLFHQNKSADAILKDLETAGITVEYVTDYEGRRFAAVFIGKIRLIDNVVYT